MRTNSSLVLIASIFVAERASALSSSSAIPVHHVAIRTCAPPSSKQYLLSIRSRSQA